MSFSNYNKSFGNCQKLSCEIKPAIALFSRQPPLLRPHKRAQQKALTDTNTSWLCPVCKFTQVRKNIVTIYLKGISQIQWINHKHSMTKSGVGILLYKVTMSRPNNSADCRIPRSMHKSWNQSNTLTFCIAKATTNETIKWPCRQDRQQYTDKVSSCGHNHAEGSVLASHFILKTVHLKKTQASALFLPEKGHPH